MRGNVQDLRPGHGIADRIVEELPFEKFVLADAGGEWITRSHLPNGMIVLTYPRCVMHCSPTGAASIVRYRGFDAEPIFASIIQALDEVA